MYYSKLDGQIRFFASLSEFVHFFNNYFIKGDDNDDGECNCVTISDFKKVGYSYYHNGTRVLVRMEDKKDGSFDIRKIDNVTDDKDFIRRVDLLEDLLISITHIANDSNGIQGLNRNDGYVTRWDDLIKGNLNRWLYMVEELNKQESPAHEL